MDSQIDIVEQLILFMSLMLALILKIWSHRANI